MMHKFIILLLTLPLLSCFEFIHEVDLNSDGSGHLNVVLNFSRSQSKIDMLLLLDEVNGHNVPSTIEIAQKLKVFEDSARVTAGVSNVNSHFNQIDYILEFSCDFDNLNTLNERIYSLWKNSEPEKAEKISYYTFEHKKLKVNIGNSAVKLFNGLSPADREVLIGADYTSILRFQETIQKQSNPSAKVIPNKKVLILQSKVLELIRKPQLFNNTVYLN
ncbi:hypothetical protein [Crocinitomix algicola]|uniref:hypothetical protein n=1 Tax=Crocinitomix algicola TaxID=1740263 RepID=UPI001112F15E|nr:hypothetical protein [Crocinitomix algicola]